MVHHCICLSHIQCSFIWNHITLSYIHDYSWCVITVSLYSNGFCLLYWYLILRQTGIPPPEYSNTNDHSSHQSNSSKSQCEVDALTFPVVHFSAYRISLREGYIKHQLIQQNINSVIPTVYHTDAHSSTTKHQLIKQNINSFIWPVHHTDIHSSTIHTT
jgi:hypothetical protein